MDTFDQQQHPITPPPELVQQWISTRSETEYIHIYITTQSARWGDEYRLNAVCEWLEYHYPSVNCLALRAAMRPKPPSLAEEALTKIDAILNDPRKSTLKDELEALELSRRALERLQQLELENHG